METLLDNLDDWDNRRLSHKINIHSYSSIQEYIGPGRRWSWKKIGQKCSHRIWALFETRESPSDQVLDVLLWVLTIWQKNPVGVSKA